MQNDNPPVPYYTAFAGERRIASGELRQVALAVKRALEADAWATALVFLDATGERVELDLRGADAEVLERLERAAEQIGSATTAAPAETPSEGQTERMDQPDGAEPPGRGRPKLGVVAREVTLLPRHWDWLNQQPGGASVALRKLVETARRAAAGKDRVRQSQEAAYHVLSALAGNLPGFEEATRALFAGDSARFDTYTEPWPADIRDYARQQAKAAFEGEQ